MKIQYVRQRGKSDCGVASVAMVTGVTYEKAFLAIGFEDGESEFFTTHSMLTEAIRTLGAEVRWRKFRAWSLVEGRAVVAVNHRYNRQYFHWIVFCEGELFDPYRPERSVVDISRYKASGWYLQVEGVSEVLLKEAQL